MSDHIHVWGNPIPAYRRTGHDPAAFKCGCGATYRESGKVISPSATLVPEGSQGAAPE